MSKKVEIGEKRRVNRRGGYRMHDTCDYSGEIEHSDFALIFNCKLREVETYNSGIENKKAQGRRDPYYGVMLDTDYDKWVTEHKVIIAPMRLNVTAAFLQDKAIWILFPDASEWKAFSYTKGKRILQKKGIEIPKDPEFII